MSADVIRSPLEETKHRGRLLHILHRDRNLQCMREVMRVVHALLGTGEQG
jgi:hypothetical protein